MTDGYKIKRVLIRPNGTEKQVYPADKGWKPGENTIAYYPLESNVNDYSGNNRNGTWGSENYTTSGTSIDVAYFNGSFATLSNFASLNYSNTTFNVWCKSASSNTWQEVFDCSDGIGQTTTTVYFGYNMDTNNAFRMQLAPANSNYVVATSPASYPNGYWHNLVAVCTPSNINLYVDGTLQATANGNGSFITNNIDVVAIGARGSGYTNYFRGYISKLILESKAWTQSEISDYYNQTKSNYGL